MVLLGARSLPIHADDTSGCGYTGLEYDVQDPDKTDRE